MKHTKEPWGVVGNPVGGIGFISGFGGITCAETDGRTEEEIHANAERIVACVNACVGMENPVEEIAELKQQLTWRYVSEELPEESHIVLASYTNACGKRRHVRAEYVPRFTQEFFDCDDYNEGSYEYREEEDTYYLKEGWYELIDNWGDFTSVLIVEGVVDKWLPIPKE